MSTKAPQGWGVDDVYDLDISTNLGPNTVVCKVGGYSLQWTGLYIFSLCKPSFQC